MTSPHYDLHGLTAAYAVGALDSVDRTRVEEHLRDCPDCRRDLREFSETTVRLANAEAEEPSARVWEGLRATVPHIRQLPPETSRRAATNTGTSASTTGNDTGDASGEASDGAAAAGSGDDGTRADGDGTVTPLRGRRRHARRGPWLPWGLAAASLVAALALGAVTTQQQARMGEMAEHTEKMEALLAASDARMMEETVPGSQAHATVVASNEYDMVMILVEGLPPAPDGMAYQLWYVDDDGGMRPAGMLESSDDGEMLSAMSADLGNASQLGISMEPADGMPSPSEEPMKVSVV